MEKIKQKFIVPVKIEMKAKMESETYKKAERQMAYIMFKNSQRIEEFIQQICREELENKDSIINS